MIQPFPVSDLRPEDLNEIASLYVQDWPLPEPDADGSYAFDDGSQIWPAITPRFWIARSPYNCAIRDGISDRISLFASVQQAADALAARGWGPISMLGNECRQLDAWGHPVAQGAD